MHIHDYPFSFDFKHWYVDDLIQVIMRNWNIWMSALLPHDSLNRLLGINPQINAATIFIKICYIITLITQPNCNVPWMLSSCLVKHMPYLSLMQNNGENTYMSNADSTEKVDRSIGQHLVQRGENLSYVSCQCCQDLCAAIRFGFIQQILAMFNP